MKYIRLLLAWLTVVWSLPCGAVVVPTSRLLSWNAGFPGGAIPFYTNSITITAAPYSADSNGVLDCFNVLTQAIANASNFSAIYFPPGTYVISNQVQIKDKAIVIRGAGSNLTHIIGRHTNSTAQGLFYVRGSSSSLTLMTNGQAVGSSAVTVTNTSSLTAGTYIITLQNNDTNTLEGDIPGGETTTSAYYQRQWNRIASVTNFTLNLDRPLYATYDPTTNLYPRVQRMVPTTNCGFEDFRITQQGTNDGIIYYFQAADCWAKGLWTSNANWYHIAYDNSWRCTAISNTHHFATTYGQGGYGVDISQSTDIKVENTVFYYLRHSVIVQNGSSGCDIFANYSTSMYDVNGTNVNFLMPDIEIHGGHAIKNVIRQNVCGKIQLDDYWGSDVLNTIERNFCYGENLNRGTNITSARYGFAMNALQLSNNIVGNVLGYLGYTGVSTNEMGGTQRSNPSDYTRVTNTMIFHANLDGKTGTVWYDPAIGDLIIPTSYASTNTPSYWGSTPWPAIGPDLAVKTNMIPAQAWWLGVLGQAPALSVTNATIVVAASAPGRAYYTNLNYRALVDY